MELTRSLRLVAFTPAVSLDRDVVVRQDLAISLLVPVLDCLPFRLDFRIEQVRKIDLSRCLGGPAAYARRLLPENERSQHKSRAPPGKIVPHLSAPSVRISCCPGGQLAHPVGHQNAITDENQAVGAVPFYQFYLLLAGRPSTKIEPWLPLPVRWR